MTLNVCIAGATGWIGKPLTRSAKHLFPEAFNEPAPQARWMVQLKGVKVATAFSSVEQRVGCRRRQPHLLRFVVEALEGRPAGTAEVWESEY